jgi:hypothetical protein
VGKLGVRGGGSTVGKLGFISIISTYISDQQRKLHYEGGFYQQILYFVSWMKVHMQNADSNLAALIQA